MSPNPGVVFRGLLDDATMFTPGNASAEQTVAEYRHHRAAWYAPVISALVVPDTALAQLTRIAADDPIGVSVVVTGGAGGLSALTRRPLPGVRITAVESALRDLDDLASNAARVVAAAAELDPEITVFVELPWAPGWVRAVEEVEAAGLYGKVRLGAEPGAQLSAGQVIEQLSVLVEADLGFKASGGSQPYGLLTLLLALDALIDGAEPMEAEEFLRLRDRERIAAAVGSWDEARQTRLRRRLRRFDSLQVAALVADLADLGLLADPG